MGITEIEIPITLNRIRCNCNKGEVLTSLFQNDYRSCSCGKVSIDWGHRENDNNQSYTELSKIYVFKVRIFKVIDVTEKLVSEFRTHIYKVTNKLDEELALNRFKASKLYWLSSTELLEFVVIDYYIAENTNKNEV